MTISTNTDMNIDLDVSELELIYESITYRLENDNHLMYHPNIRKDLEDMIAVFEDEYL
tara:strand:+ start:1336 stop:1509 length:174 start_codon:yes stop_codon:yes gene_type:complete